MARSMQKLYPGGAGAAEDWRDERWRRMWSHREQLMRVARRRSMSVEDAEDAVHEAMLRAGENPHIDDERLAAWLTTVTMRLCVDRYRQLYREAEVGSRSALAAPAPVPVEEAVCDQAEAKWLERRSKTLPARQAEALRLKSEELDVGQVATQMGLSYEATESLLSRARRAMRGVLAGTLGLAVWLVRGRPETGVVPAAAVGSTAVTLALLGIALPYAYDGEVPPAPQVSRTDKAQGPVGEHDRKGPAAPRSTARRDGGPALVPGLGKPLPVTSALVPRLPEPPATPRVPEAPAVPDVPDVPTPPSPSAGVRLPSDKPAPSAPAAPSAPTEAGGPDAGLPSVSGTPTDVPEPLG
jgi:RNA polymerase sigma factor (sigma-70 family)